MVVLPHHKKTVVPEFWLSKYGYFVKKKKKIVENWLFWLSAHFGCFFLLVKLNHKSCRIQTKMLAWWVGYNGITWKASVRMFFERIVNLWSLSYVQFLQKLWIFSIYLRANLKFEVIGFFIHWKNVWSKVMRTGTLDITPHSNYSGTDRTRFSNLSGLCEK